MSRWNVKWIMTWTCARGTCYTVSHWVIYIYIYSFMSISHIQTVKIWLRQNEYLSHQSFFQYSDGKWQSSFEERTSSEFVTTSGWVKDDRWTIVHLCCWDDCSFNMLAIQSVFSPFNGSMMYWHGWCSFVLCSLIRPTRKESQRERDRHCAAVLCAQHGDGSDLCTHLPLRSPLQYQHCPVSGATRQRCLNTSPEIQSAY